MTDNEKDLRLLVRKALTKCTKESTPNFYEMLQSEDGYKKAEDLVLNYSLQNVISVTSAVGQLESTLSE